MFEDILCAVDGSRRSFDAVEQAAIMAGARGHLTLVSVSAVTGAGAYRNAAISPPRAEHVLERAGDIARRCGVHSTAILDPDGPAAEAITKRAALHQLLALGGPAAPSLGSMFVDSVAEAAMDSLTVPLLECRAAPHHDGHFLDRILVASDAREGSDELVEMALRLAREHDSHVVLVHAVGVESQARPHRIKQQAARLEAALPGTAEIRIEVGNAAEGILAAASETGVSLIVMGTRQLTGLRAIGSVSRKVAHGAACSVLLVPPVRP